MSNGNGHHWSKFSWRDWTNDKALHSCSLGARAFWLELLAIMHEGTPTGHLTINGKPVTLRQMAANANCTAKEATKALAELDEAGVFSRTTEGVIYCRRMVRDAVASEVGREHAEKRWGANRPTGHPNGVPNGVGIGEATGRPNGEANGTPIAKSQKLESETEQEKEESKRSIYNYSLSSPETRAREAPSGSQSLSYDELHDVPTLTEIRENREAFARENAAAVTTGAGVRRVANALSPTRLPEAKRSKWEQIAGTTDPPKPTTASSYAAPARTPEQQLAELLSIPLEQAAARFTAHAA